MSSTTLFPWEFLLTHVLVAGATWLMVRLYNSYNTNTLLHQQNQQTMNANVLRLSGDLENTRKEFTKQVKECNENVTTVFQHVKLLVDYFNTLETNRQQQQAALQQQQQAQQQEGAASVADRNPPPQRPARQTQVMKPTPNIDQTDARRQAEADLAASKQAIKAAVDKYTKPLQETSETASTEASSDTASKGTKKK